MPAGGSAPAGPAPATRTGAPPLRKPFWSRPLLPSPRVPMKMMLFATLLLLGAAPAAAPAPVAPNLPIEAYRLPNGLRVVLQRDKALPRVTVCVAYHVGSKDERAG